VIVYLDTSALVKLFMDEPDTAVVADLLQHASVTFTHLITYAEARAALAKAARMQRLTGEMHIAYKVALESYWEKLDVISLNMSQIKRAGDLAETHGLRGYDCVQLAAAELIFEQSRDFTFASFDQHLNKAAGAIGMQIL